MGLYKLGDGSSVATAGHGREDTEKFTEIPRRRSRRLELEAAPSEGFMIGHVYEAERLDGGEM
jgi:hypothetical protein